MFDEETGLWKQYLGTAADDTPPSVSPATERVSETPVAASPRKAPSRGGVRGWWESNSKWARIGMVGLIVLFVLVAVGVLANTDNSSTNSVSSRCEPLPSQAANFLGSALDSGSLVNPVTVRSNDFSHVYFVAAMVNGEPALWAMNRLDGSGLIFSENDHAFDVSGMGRGDTTDAHVTDSDDGASDALSCVGG